MIELYSIKDVSKIFGLRESRLRYWIASGFLWPSVRRRGHYFYTFEDLVTVKTAVELIDRGVSTQKVRAALQALRGGLPEGRTRNSRLRICSDGTDVVIVEDGVAFEPKTRQIVMAFEVATLESQIAKILPLHDRESAVPDPVFENEATERQALPSAYQLFLHGCEAEEHGDPAQAERYYQQCLAIEESMAAAHTNLGNLLYAQGRLEEARAAYDQALLFEPEQPEARFNLGNILEDLGNTEMAIAELRQVCTRCPDFADAHYNLGLLLARVGGHAQASEHLQRYLRIDGDSEWAHRARGFLAEQCA